MKNLLLIATLFLVTASPIAAQKPEPYHHLYLPTITMTTNCERTWRIIKPDGVSNEVLNPSAETTGNFAGAAATRSTTYSHYGLYSYRLQTVAGGQGIVLTTAALANATHYVTLRVRGALPPAWALTIGATIRYPRLIEAIDADWSLYGARFTAAECNGQTSLSVTQAGAGSGDFYVDGVQVEANTHWTTYIDGTQEGCAWDGAEHASVSNRSAQSRAGGTVCDLWADYGFFVEEVVGVGAAPETVSTRSYAILPGGELSGSKTNERNFTLIGRFVGESEADLHAKRQELLEELAIDTYPEKQAVRVRFSGATVQKQIAAYYTGGLEAQLKTSYGPWQVEGDEAWRKLNYWTEKVAIQFLAPDPLWYEIGESAVLLDTNDSATVRTVAARLRNTGKWDNLGPPAVVIANYVYVAAFARGHDGTVFIGGNFQDWNDVLGVDNIVQYDPITGTYSALGTSTNSDVLALVVGPDGTLYVGGYFASAGGVPNTFRVASWNGTAWAALGAGLNNNVYCLTIGRDGILYIGGDFTDVQGGPGGTYNRIVSWNGAAYAALGVGMDGRVRSVAMGPDGTLYAAGEFANAGGNLVNYIAQWDGTAWSDLDGGMDNHVYTIVVDSDGTLYAGGPFTTAGSTSVNYVAKWNGTAWTPLGSGTNNTVSRLFIGPDDMLYAGGNFTSAGGVDLTDRMARWNGASWAHMDIDIPGAAVLSGLLADRADPVINRIYDIYIGFNTSGTAYFADIITAMNDGSQPAYPKIIVSRSGGTSAILETIRNEDTGKILLLDYGLLSGEQLVIDLEPTQKSIVSSMFGDRLDAILPNSDFGSFALQPGNNNISAFVDVSGAPIITAYMLWRDTYKSLD